MRALKGPGLSFAFETDGERVWVRALDGMDIETTSDAMDLGPLADVAQAFADFLERIDYPDGVSDRDRG